MHKHKSRTLHQSCGKHMYSAAGVMQSTSCPHAQNSSYSRHSCCSSPLTCTDRKVPPLLRLLRGQPDLQPAETYTIHGAAHHLMLGTFVEIAVSAAAGCSLQPLRHSTPCGMQHGDELEEKHVCIAHCSSSTEFHASRSHVQKPVEAPYDLSIPAAATLHPALLSPAPLPYRLPHHPPHLNTAWAGCPGL
jgi:hypothetical protein